MARRMIDPQTIIKSQIVDDKNIVDLNEILEKYGTVIDDGTKTITLQIYNKIATDETQNTLEGDTDLGFVLVNGSITITKLENGDTYIQGMIVNSNWGLITYLDASGENQLKLKSSDEFDLHVIRV